MTLPGDAFRGPVGYDVDSNYARILSVWRSNPFRDEKHCNTHSNNLLLRVLKPLDEQPSDQFLDTIGNVQYGVYHHEQLYEIREPLPLQLSLLECEDILARHTERLDAADRVFVDYFEYFFRQVPPKLAFQEQSAQSVQLIDFANNPALLIEECIRVFGDPSLFPKFAEIFSMNVLRASGLRADNLPNATKYKYPTDSKLTPSEINNVYFAGTPFIQLLRLPVPFGIPKNIRYEHTHVLAGSGHGKTTLLTDRFLEDLDDDSQPAIIVLDGKGTWAPDLQKFGVFAPGQRHSDRLRIINPQDTSFPVSLNMFQLPASTPESSREVMREAIAENLAYIFESRKFDLSAKQGTAFAYAAKVIFLIPGGNLDDLRALMQDGLTNQSDGIPANSRFRPYIEQLDPDDRQFIEDMFYTYSEYGETRRQIQNRIYNLTSNKPFRLMFKQRENRLDMLDIMQSGKILVIDASPGAVGEATASTFGKYIISLALATARTRIHIPRKQWKSVWLYVDEAQMFVDEERTQPLLQQAREFNLGVVLAHQKLMDLTPTLRATFAANTSTKYCGGPGRGDAQDMAKDMRTDADFIMDQRKVERQTTQFATHVRGFTPRALSYTIKLGTADNTVKMTDAAYAQVIARNREIMCAPPSQDTAEPPQSISERAMPTPPSGPRKRKRPNSKPRDGSSSPSW